MRHLQRMGHLQRPRHLYYIYSIFANAVPGFMDRACYITLTKALHKSITHQTFNPTH
ncbi:MAG: hypothetical protein II294_03430 [Muribaculaceae bacterium]|nr:hypothetical protein [Muribaculaceae bacterium]